MVSGHAQQIFFFGFDSGTDVVIIDPWFGCDSAVATVEEEPFKGSPPIVTSVSSIQDDMLEKQKGIKYVKFKAENRFRTTLCVATPIELPSNLTKLKFKVIMNRGKIKY